VNFGHRLRAAGLPGRLEKGGRLFVPTLAAELADQLPQTVVGVAEGRGHVRLGLSVDEHGPQGFILALIRMLGLGEEGSAGGAGR
jgi:hypothetical protein